MVICITGNGLKTQDPLVGKLPDPGLDRAAAWPTSTKLCESDGIRRS